MKPEEIKAVLRAHLTAAGAGWLEASLEQVAATPGVIRTLFPAAGRQCGRAVIVSDARAASAGTGADQHLPYGRRSEQSGAVSDGRAASAGTGANQHLPYGRSSEQSGAVSDGISGWSVDDAARVLLLAGLPLTGPELAREVCDLYWYGDAAEKRGVLRALAHLDVGDAALPVVRDALRTNDTRLIAAALGPYAATHLDDAAYRQAVLKCVFTGVPLAEVAGLAERRDAELVRMFTDFARERVAAGRPVPEDVWRVTRP